MSLKDPKNYSFKLDEFVLHGFNMNQNAKDT